MLRLKAKETLKATSKKNVKIKRLISLALLLVFLVVAITGVFLLVFKSGVRESQSYKLHVISGLIMIPLTIAHVILEMKI